jgi:hypothetical protein
MDIPLPPQPTIERPGSESKVIVMSERYDGGYSIFHPHDADNEDAVAWREKTKPRPEGPHAR